MCSLPGGGQLSSAAIVGHDGGVWAQSAGFPAISKTEVDALLAGLADPAKLAMTGIVIGGEKARADAPSRAAAALGAAQCRAQLRSVTPLTASKCDTAWR
jgi:profilin